MTHDDLKQGVELFYDTKKHIESFPLKSIDDMERRITCSDYISYEFIKNSLTNVVYKYMTQTKLFMDFRTYEMINTFISEVYNRYTPVFSSIYYIQKGDQITESTFVSDIGMSFSMEIYNLLVKISNMQSSYTMNYNYYEVYNNYIAMVVSMHPSIFSDCMDIAISCLQFMNTIKNTFNQQIPSLEDK